MSDITLTLPVVARKKAKSGSFSSLLAASSSPHHSNNERSEQDSSNNNKRNGVLGSGGLSRLSLLEQEKIQREIEDELISVIDEKKEPFRLGDALPLLHDGVKMVVEDSFSRCFLQSDDEPWNWNSYLLVLWCLGVVFRYCILFPLRLFFLILGCIVFTICFSTVSFFVKDEERRSSYQRKLIRFLCGTLVFSWTGVIKYHGVIPSRDPNQIYVANHSSMIDMIILQQLNTFSVVGQQHTGWVGWLQDRVLSCLDCVWFERSKLSDRAKSAAKIKNHIARPGANRLLLFPEGTCVNNKYIVQFKKGAFEMGAEICPIAIKYNKIFVDGYWNSRAQSFLMHLFTLMSSWAVVCDVTYLEPQSIGADETGAEFAKRVQLMIAKKAGLKAVDWDGYMKYFRPSRRFVMRRQELFAKRLLQAMRAKGVDSTTSVFSSTGLHQRLCDVIETENTQ